MDLTLTLALPRDGASVPAARRALTGSLRGLGVEPEVLSDIEIALTEACANVLKHAEESDEYEVGVRVSGRECVIEVRDAGLGFDPAGQGLQDAAPSAEGGRGIQLMRALVDRVQFTTSADSGTVVHLEKRLSWDDSSVLGQLEQV